MPTKKKRITLALDQKTINKLERLKKVFEVKQNAKVIEILIELNNY